MRRSPSIALATALLIATSRAPAQQAAPLINPTGAAVQPAAPATGGLSVDDVLDLLDRRGQDLQAFDAQVTLREEDTNTALATTRTGKVWYEKKADGSARMRVLFDKKIDARDRQVDEKIEYALDNGWLIDRDYQKRIEVRRQVLRPGEKINLLKLGEGPFPLPIGQKKEEVRKLFDAKLVKPSRDDDKSLAGTSHVVLKPIDKTQFARRFGAIDVWVDPKTGMPVRIETITPNGGSTRSTDLRNVRINPRPGLTDADFALPKIDQSKWNVQEEPYS